jgi:hypothetical protein
MSLSNDANDDRWRETADAATQAVRRGRRLGAVFLGRADRHPRRVSRQLRQPPLPINWGKTDAAHHAPDRRSLSGLRRPARLDCPDEGRPVGRIYEDISASAPADRRWTWSITVYVWPDAGIATSGKAATLVQAKAQFQRNWSAWSKQAV